LVGGGAVIDGDGTRDNTAVTFPSLPLRRYFGTASGSGLGGRNDDDEKKKKEEEEAAKDASNNNDNDKDDDPFGLKPPKSGGNILPPSYIRDPTTGKFTGEIEAEMSYEDEMLLDLDLVERERMLADRFVSSWNKENNDDDDVEGRDEMNVSVRRGVVASRIRDEEMALNVLGRKPSDVASGIDEEYGYDGDKDEVGSYGSGREGEGGGDLSKKFTRPLSESEFAAFREYAKREHDIADLTEDDVPVIWRKTGTSSSSSSSRRTSSPIGKGDYDPDVDLEWMSAAARAEMSDGRHNASEPFVDLLPSDLNPSRKANRRTAKKIPPELLHHNNLALLRRYVSPGGQIMNRVQSRLGARDQRKIAKLIKRARCLGLIPFYGQWKFEDKGDLHEKDLDVDREWEKELARRGLVVSRLERVVNKGKGNRRSTPSRGEEE